MSFDGPAASTSGWCTRPGERGIGSTGCAGRHRTSLLTGLYAMATAEHREPCDSRGSCTVLGAPEGETPSGDSSDSDILPSVVAQFETELPLPWLDRESELPCFVLGRP